MPGTTHFPASLDDDTTLASDYTVGEQGHIDAHENINAALKATQAKLGIDGSTDPDSLEYRLTILETTMTVPDALEILVYPGTSGNVTLPAACSKVRLRGAPGASGTVSLTKAGGSPVVLAIGSSPVDFVVASGVVVAVDASNLAGGAASVVGS